MNFNLKFQASTIRSPLTLVKIFKFFSPLIQQFDFNIPFYFEGRLLYTKVYIFALTIFENLILTIVLLFMAVLAILKFRWKISRLSEHILRTTESCNNKIVLTIITCFVFTRILDMISSLSIRYILFFKYTDPEYLGGIGLPIINFFRQLTLFIYFFLHAFNGFIYLFNDKNLISSIH